MKQINKKKRKLKNTKNKNMGRIKTCRKKDEK